MAKEVKYVTHVINISSLGARGDDQDLHSAELTQLAQDGWQSVSHTAKIKRGYVVHAWVFEREVSVRQPEPERYATVVQVEAVEVNNDVHEPMHITYIEANEGAQPVSYIEAVRSGKFTLEELSAIGNDEVMRKVKAAYVPPAPSTPRKPGENPFARKEPLTIKQSA